MSDIVIEQDYEVDPDGDGEVGPALDVYWTTGHGHDEYVVIRAVVDHCLDSGRDIPRIDGDYGPREVWQTTRPCGGGAFEYVRADTRNGLPSYTRASDITPVTLLDLDGRRRGNTRCSVRDCRAPWKKGVPIRVVTGPDPAPYVSVEVWMCREHSSLLPDAYYRLAVVPVGATIELPAPTAPPHNPS